MPQLENTKLGVGEVATGAAIADSEEDWIKEAFFDLGLEPPSSISGQRTAGFTNGGAGVGRGSQASMRSKSYVNERGTPFAALHVRMSCLLNTRGSRVRAMPCNTAAMGVLLSCGSGNSCVASFLFGVAFGQVAHVAAHAARRR